MLIRSRFIFQEAANRSFLLPIYAKPPLILNRGHGCVVEDTEGRSYLDLTAGIAVTALGHSHPVVTRAIHEQADKLLHCSNLFHNTESETLAKSLIRSLLMSSGTNSRYQSHWEQGHVFFCNSGTEANEAALKFARRYGKHRGDSSKYQIISFFSAFHGRSLGALSATPNYKYQKPFMPMLPGFQYATLNDIRSVQSIMEDSCNGVCAVIVEPIQGEGGIFPADAGFLQDLRQLCDEHDALLIFDEIQCGMGRSGKAWAHHYDQVCPDIITAAKPLANGLPIGAVLVTDSVASTLSPGDHGTTFGGNPFACHVAQAVVREIMQPTFLHEVGRKGNQWKQQLHALQQKYPTLIRDVRGRGLMLGLELSMDPGSTVIPLARERGLLVCGAGRNVLRLVPPLVITDQEIKQATDILDSCFSTLSANMIQT